MKNYAIKDGYKAREQNEYYEDSAGTAIYQPDVYTAAVKLARNIGANNIIDIGSGNGEKLIPFAQDFKFIFVDYGANLKIIEQNFGKRGTYLEQDLETGFPKLSNSVLQKAVIICSDVIEHLIKPDILIKSMVKLSGEAPFVLISTPDRQTTRGVGDYGPPQNAAHVREWSMEEMDSLFHASGLQGHLTGITRSNSYEQVRHTSVIMAGTFVDGLSKPPAKTTDIDDFLARPTIALKSGEQLASIPPFSASTILADAKQRGFKQIEAQVIYINPDAAYAWPENGITKQGHGLVGQVGEVRTFTINKSAKKVSTYPIRLIIFSPIQNTDLTNKISSGASSLVDTGHLADDYMLETLVGWDILGEEVGQF